MTIEAPSSLHAPIPIPIPIHPPTHPSTHTRARAHRSVSQSINQLLPSIPFIRSSTSASACVPSLPPPCAWQLIEQCPFVISARAACCCRVSLAPSFGARMQRFSPTLNPTFFLPYLQRNVELVGKSEPGKGELHAAGLLQCDALGVGVLCCVGVEWVCVCV
jgi:hypothetical protein